MLCQSQAHHAPDQPTNMQGKMDQHNDPNTFFKNKQAVIFKVMFQSPVKSRLVYDLKRK